MAEAITRRDFLKSTALVTAGVTGLPLCQLVAASAEPDSSAMPQRILGKTGLKVSILGVGGAAGPVEASTDQELVAKYLQAAADSGINFFDTAGNYGKEGLCERNFGLIMGTPRRKELILASKCEERSYDGAMRQFQTSLQRMKTDHIDLMQVHNVQRRDDVKAFGAKDGVLTALQKLRDQKVIRLIGMTGHAGCPKVKDALEMYEWDTLMCYANPARFSQPALEVQIPLAQKKNMGIIAMKVLGGEKLSIVGSGPGKTDAATLLRFAWSCPIHTAVVGMSSLEELRANVAAARNFKPLTDQERKALLETINQGKPWAY